MTFRAFSSFCAALLLAALWFPPPARSAAPEPIRLGMSAPFSGPSRGLGIEYYRGATAWFEHLNRERPDYLGRPVVVVAKDDGYEPDRAVRNTLAFIDDPSILLLFGYVGTPTVTRILPLLRGGFDKDALLFFPFTGAQPLREEPYANRIFNLRASYREETRRLVDRLMALGRRRIGILCQADAYGRAGWDGVRRALAPYGLRIAAEATYARGVTFQDSMRQQVDILHEASPDAIISIGSYEAAAAFIRDARDQGLDVPIANLSFVGSENLLQLLARAGQRSGRDYTAGLLNTQVVPSYGDMDLQAAREYHEIMSRLAPDGPPPGTAVPEGNAAGHAGPYRPLPASFPSFEGFLAAKVLSEVLRNLPGEPERVRVRAAAESLGGCDPGIGSRVKFGPKLPEGHQGLSEIYFTTAKEGMFLPVTNWAVWAK